MILPFPAIFRFLAWLALVGGMAGAWLILNASGFVAAFGALASTLVVFVLWQALAWAIDALDATRARATETARDVEQMLTRLAPSETQRPSMAFAKPNTAAPRSIPDAPLWPNALVALQPVASHNGVEIAVGPNGQWTARKDGESISYADAGALAAWLRTLPKP
jgi:hypothetical protein